MNLEVLMNKRFLIILASVVVHSLAHASEMCVQLFKNNNLAVMSAAKSGLPDVISKPTHNMIVAALKRDIQQGFEYSRHFRVEPIEQMLKIGIPREVVAKEIREGLKNELSDMARVSTQVLELPVKTPPKVSRAENILNAKVSIEEFIEYHKLEAESAAVTKILNYNDFSRHEGVNPIEVLKAALLTGQKDLAREAFIQGFRFNKLSELGKLGIETGNNEILMNIGRISITKFLIYDRNQNYLKDGLDALLEIKGLEKKQAEALLIDFVDILKGPEILRNEDSVSNFGDRGNKLQYLEIAFTALKSASELTGRALRDSVSYDHFVQTRDQRIISRLREVVRLSYIESPLGLGNGFEAVAILKDAGLAESLSTHHLRTRFTPDRSASKVVQENWKKINTRRAVEFAMLTGDTQVIKRVIKEIFESDRMDESNNVSGGVKLFSKDMTLLKSVTGVNRIIRLLGDLAKEKNLDPQHLKFLENTKKNLIEDLRSAAEKKPDLKTEVFSNSNRDLFRHHRDAIEHALTKSESGDQDAGLWRGFVEATRQRNIAKLKIIYQKMMTEGRGLDAVYAALSIAVLENGGDINTIKSLQDASYPRQIENR